MPFRVQRESLPSLPFRHLEALEGPVSLPSFKVAPFIRDEMSEVMVHPSSITFKEDTTAMIAFLSFIRSFTYRPMNSIQLHCCSESLCLLEMKWWKRTVNLFLL